MRTTLCITVCIAILASGGCAQNKKAAAPKGKPDTSKLP